MNVVYQFPPVIEVRQFHTCHPCKRGKHSSCNSAFCKCKPCDVKVNREYWREVLCKRK